MKRARGGILAGLRLGVLAMAALVAVAASAQSGDGPPATEGDWESFFDGMDGDRALDIIDVLVDSDAIGVARDANTLLNDLDALDATEAGCGSAYTDSSGPTVPSHCAEGDACRQCYEEAVRKIDFNRFYIERARCITAANVKMANSAMAFGDSASGIHAVSGLSWQLQGKPQIEQAVGKLKQTYTHKAGQYLDGLQGALKELGQCEAEHYGEDDWYQRYGWIYHNFMQAKYGSPPE
ncbi:hypothetical protein [Marilutibacter spongiae]|uniref:Uncharacterized protein n=1 Tax=Marilutibacter spongiae TaxID=2025720 RepID=A0A7W3TMS3_9GAMM|nr:hypothetical protein [Lysobacter spongiae]MBB1061220.1 hypothetical protein [Lysobacter spongiae]